MKAEKQNIKIINLFVQKKQRCQARIIEEETAKHATDGKSKPSAVLFNPNEIVNETKVNAFESRSSCSCKKIIFRYETTQSRRKLNSETLRTILETRRNEKRKRKNLFQKMKERIETFFAADEKKNRPSLKRSLKK